MNKELKNEEKGFSRGETLKSINTNRRSFIKGTVIATSAVAAGGLIVSTKHDAGSWTSSAAPPQDSPAFNLRPTVEAFRGLGTETVSVVRELSSLINFDVDRGSFNVDLVALGTRSREMLSEDVVAPFVSAVGDVANGRLAIFGRHEDLISGGALTTPWVVISDLAFSLLGTPAGMRSALGIDGVGTIDEATQILRNNFRNVPDWFLGEGAVQRLIRNSVRLPGDEWEGPGGGPDPEDRPPKPPGHNRPRPSFDGIVAPAIDATIEAARCLINGSWSGLGGAWWGWAFGWQVCVSQDCADKIAKVLLTLGGGPALFKAIGQVLAAETIAAGIKALSITAGAALALYALFLGANILAVNGPNGVCIQGNWPVIGGPGAFIWAVPR